MSWEKDANGFHTSSIICGHANESGVNCDCLPDCYCRAPGRMCGPKTEHVGMSEFVTVGGEVRVPVRSYARGGTVYGKPCQFVIPSRFNSPADLDSGYCKRCGNSNPECKCCFLPLPPEKPKSKGEQIAEKISLSPLHPTRFVAGLISQRIASAINAAIAEEREACIDLADRHRDIAAAMIRNRRHQS